MAVGGAADKLETQLGLTLHNKPVVEPDATSALLDETEARAYLVDKGDIDEHKGGFVD